MSLRRCSNDLLRAPVVPSKMNFHHLYQESTASSPYQFRINHDSEPFPAESKSVAVKIK